MLVARATNSLTCSRLTSLELDHYVGVIELIRVEAKAAALANEARPRRVARVDLAGHLRHGPRQARTALPRRQVRRALRRREDTGEPPPGVATVHLHLTRGEPPARVGRGVLRRRAEQPGHEAVERAGGGGGHGGEAADDGLLHRVVRGGQEVGAGVAHVAGVVVHADVHVGGAEGQGVAEAGLEAVEAGEGLEVAAAEPDGVHGLVGRRADGGGGEELGGGGGVGGESAGDSAEIDLVRAAARVAAAAAVAGRSDRIGRWRDQREDEHDDEDTAVVHGVGKS